MGLPLPSPVGAGSRPGSDPWLAFVLVRDGCRGGLHAPCPPLLIAESPYNRRPAVLPNPGPTRTRPNGPRPTHPRNVGGGSPGWLRCWSPWYPWQYCRYFPFPVFGAGCRGTSEGVAGAAGAMEDGHGKASANAHAIT